MAQVKHNKLKLPGHHQLVLGRDGVFVANENDIYVGGALITYGEFSHLEMDEFAKWVDKDTTVIEIGANIGAHTVGLAKMAKRVIAIEPQPFIFYSLCAQVVLNSLHNVECHNVAIADPSAGPIFIPNIDYSAVNNFGGVELGESDGTYIDSWSLDFLVERLSIGGKVFLKVDVEGMEESVLRSGINFLRENKPVMYVENDRVQKSKSLLEFIHSLGYNTIKHQPYLFNPKNYFGKTDNKWPNIASFNELCIPSEI